MLTRQKRFIFFRARWDMRFPYCRNGVAATAACLADVPTLLGLCSITSPSTVFHFRSAKRPLTPKKFKSPPCVRETERDVGYSVCACTLVCLPATIEFVCTLHLPACMCVCVYASEYRPIGLVNMLLFGDSAPHLWHRLIGPPALFPPKGLLIN